MKKKLTILALGLILIGLTYTIFAATRPVNSDPTPDHATEESIRLATFEDDFENGLFVFNPDRHVVIDRPWNASWSGRPYPFDVTMESVLQNPREAVLIVEVAGPSINRIIDPAWHLTDFSRPTGFNHVITPMLVHHIIHAGEELLMDLKVGKITNILENYFYVTPETQAYVDGVSLGTVMVNMSSVPMEVGSRYLIIAHDGDGGTGIYQYQGERILGAMFIDSVFLLDPSAPPPDAPYGFDHYTEWWTMAMEMFGDLYDLPWVPMPEPRHQLTFTLNPSTYYHTIPTSITPINIPIGTNILDFLAAHHDDLPINNPLKQNHNFMGWYMDDDFTIPLTDTTLMPDYDTTLYARWEHRGRSHMFTFYADPPEGGNPTAYLEGHGFIQSGTRVPHGSRVFLDGTVNPGFGFRQWRMYIGSHNFEEEENVVQGGVSRMTINNIGLDFYFVGEFFEITSLVDDHEDEDEAESETP